MNGEKKISPVKVPCDKHLSHLGISNWSVIFIQNGTFHTKIVEKGDKTFVKTITVDSNSMKMVVEIVFCN